MSSQLCTLKPAVTHLKLASEPRCHHFGFGRTCLLGSKLAFEPIDLRAIEELITDRRLGLRCKRGSRSAVYGGGLKATIDNTHRA